MMCCVDVQRRFGDIDWEASLDILVLPEQPHPWEFFGMFWGTGLRKSKIPGELPSRRFLVSWFPILTIPLTTFKTLLLMQHAVTL